jgi:hypothetical protein
MFAHLRSIVFAVWTALHPLAPRAPDASAIADGIALAVATDVFEPLTGTREGDAALTALYAYRESSLQACGKSGDGGRSWGAWQLQRVARATACDPVAAAPIWLSRARASVQACATLPLEERLAALASGSCSRGRALVAWRWRQASALLAQVAP